MGFIAEDVRRRHICLPISAVMTEDEAYAVVEALERETGNGKWEIGNRK